VVSEWHRGPGSNHGARKSASCQEAMRGKGVRKPACEGQGSPVTSERQGSLRASKGPAMSLRASNEPESQQGARESARGQA